MKKQGDLYLKIVSIVLAGIVVAYLVLSVLFGSGGSSYTLETAVRCEAGDGQTVSGFVVREEEIITASQPVVVCALTEGERVGSGQRVADGYQTSAAREKRDRLTALQEQLSQLRYAASGTAGEDTTQTDDAIEKALGELATLTARRDLTEADDVMSELQPLVLRRSVTADDAARMEGRIAELESQISALSAETEQSAEAVTVESAGYFSEQTDGLERVLTPESVLQMKPSELRAAAQHASAVPGNAVGRLITGQKWYFAAEIPEARAEQTAAGETLTVSFGLEKLSQIRMQVEAISEAEDGVASASRRRSRPCAARARISFSPLIPACACRSRRSIWSMGRRASMCSRARAPAGSRWRSFMRTETATLSSWISPARETSGRATILS